MAQGAAPQTRIFYHGRTMLEQIPRAAEPALLPKRRVKVPPDDRRPPTCLKAAAPGCKISSLPRHAPAREHDEQDRHQTAGQDGTSRRASAPAQGYSVQRRLYAARLRGPGAEGGISSQ